MKNIEDYNSEELRELLVKRKEFEAIQADNKDAIYRKTALEFLKGKSYLIETHSNESCITMYEVNTSYNPIVVNENDRNYVSIELISELYLTIDEHEPNEEDRYDASIRIDSKIVCTKYDDFGMNKKCSGLPSKIKLFNADTVLEKVSELSKERYLAVMEVWQLKENMIISAMKQLKSE